MTPTPAQRGGEEVVYQERYSIERTNAWMDSFRSILNRFDNSFNYIAFPIIFLKKIYKNKKSR